MRTLTCLFLLMLLNRPAIAQPELMLKEYRLEPILTNENDAWLPLLKKAQPEGLENELLLGLDFRISKLRGKILDASVSGKGNVDVLVAEVNSVKAEHFEQLLSNAKPELLMTAIQEENLAFLQRAALEKNSFDLTHLTNRDLIARLSLSGKQQEHLDDHLREIANSQKNHVNEIVKKFNSLTEEKLLKFKALLDVSQVNKFEDLIGEPVAWIRMLNFEGNFGYEFKLSDVEPKGNGYRIYVPEDYSDDSRLIDYFVFKILDSPFFYDELDIVDDQVVELKKIVRNFRKFDIITSEKSFARWDDLLDGKAEYPDELQELFLRGQIKKLRQIELQFRTGNYRSSFGLLHPRISEHLELSSKQTAQLKAFSDEYRIACDRFLSDSILTLRKALRDDHVALFKLLTTEQIQQYSLLTGLNTSSIQSR